MRKKTTGFVTKLRYEYKLTYDEYLNMYEEQNGCCAICGIPEHELGKELHIDHCHDQGHARGLLCFNCNHGLGNFNDSTRLLEIAADYLDNNRYYRKHNRL